MSGMKILEELAKKQFGAVSRQQVVAALVHRSSIASKVKTGQLERVHLGLLAHLKQYEVYDLNGDYVMRLDFCWPHLKVALHVDGFRWHSQRERFDRDARQRSRLSALGWRTVTVTFNTFADGSWLNDLLTLLNPQSELALQ